MEIRSDPTCPPPRVTVTEDGPFLVDGSVELVSDDGSSVRSDRVVVAVCACRRSKRYPFCDTSHRQRVRTDATDWPLVKPVLDV